MTSVEGEKVDFAAICGRLLEKEWKLRERWYFKSTKLDIGETCSNERIAMMAEYGNKIREKGRLTRWKGKRAHNLG